MTETRDAPRSKSVSNNNQFSPLGINSFRHTDFGSTTTGGFSGASGTNATYFNASNLVQ